MTLKCRLALAKHPPIRCVLVGLSLLIADSVCFAEKIPEGKLGAEHIAKVVKVTAEALAKSNSLAIKKPIFEFDDQRKELQYYIGNVRVEMIGLGSNDPYLFVFQRQIQIEALRKTLNLVLPNEAFWKRILDRLEQLVVSAVNDIENTVSSDEISKKIEQKDEQFGAFLGELHQAIKVFAESRGYTARRVGDRVIASDSFTVRIVKKPSAGKVLVLPYVKYIQCSKLLKCGNSWSWRELISESESMIGEYYYQAEWQGGRRSEGKIDVRNNTTMTFSPKE